jgi:hypothetical protein
VRAFDGEHWTVFTPQDIGMGQADQELITGWVLATVEGTDQVWVGQCNWGGPGPFGGQGARWFDGQMWRGADSPVAHGCANAIEADGDGRVWIGVDSDLWRYDPASDDWAQFSAPEPPSPHRRFGFVAHILMTASGDPWPNMATCGGAACDGDGILYRVHDGVWTQVMEGSTYLLHELVFDTAGTPWLFKDRTIYRLQGDLLVPMLDIPVYSVAVDTTGRIWLVAHHEGRELLLILDTDPSLYPE